MESPGRAEPKIPMIPQKKKKGKERETSLCEERGPGNSDLDAARGRRLRGLS